MVRLTSFTFITLDGYYKDLQEGIDWHAHGEEEAQWSAENASGANPLLFGRKTFELMRSFWPTTMAFSQFPEVARGMNKANKYVVSNTLKETGWENSRLLQGNLADEVKKLKQTEVQDIAILGSGSLIRQLTDAGLIDSYGIMIDPIAIGKGVSLFRDIQEAIPLKLVKHKIFQSGIVYLEYENVKM